MARMNRFAPVDVPIHLVQRGLKKQQTFRSENDFFAYLNWLKDYADKYQVDIHAWVLMPNHVHVLCTPTVEGGVSQMMQSLGRQYVKYFNKLYNRSGSLWEGRYRSCIVQADYYLLEVHKYIELNPVRAKITMTPDEYLWSSYHANAHNKTKNICKPHQEYLKLGRSEKVRAKQYCRLFEQKQYQEIITEIRENTFKCLAIGDDSFKEKVQEITGRRLVSRKPGRPLGWKKLKL